MRRYLSLESTPMIMIKSTRTVFHGWKPPIIKSSGVTGACRLKREHRLLRLRSPSQSLWRTSSAATKAESPDWTLHRTSLGEQRVCMGCVSLAHSLTGAQPSSVECSLARVTCGRAGCECEQGRKGSAEVTWTLLRKPKYLRKSIPPTCQARRSIRVNTPRGGERLVAATGTTPVFRVC